MDRAPIGIALVAESQTEPEPELTSVVRAAQAGDRTAQRAIFDRHQGEMLGFCLVAAGGDRDRALDLLQDTFVRVYRALPTLRDPEKFRGWLFAVAANVCRTRGAQEQRQRRVLEAVGLEEEVEPPVDDEAERESRVAAVQRVLAHVRDERLRRIVQLKYGDPEHTTREIAAKLSIPHGTVTVKLMRFRAAIRRELCRALLEEGVS
jgi:RNA polymerase sigma-70 factor (ECF subfamily)